MKLSHLSEGVLFEAGLSRILSHSDKPFAILTAFRANFSTAENRKRNRALEARFRDIGTGGIKLIGHWLEAPEGQWFGKDYSEIDPGQLTDVVEESYFVPLSDQRMSIEEFREWIVKTIHEFDQDAAVFSDGSAIFLIDKANDLVNIGTGISVDKVQQAYSSIKGKNFVFEGSMRPSGVFHRMLLRKRGIGWI